MKERHCVWGRRPWDGTPTSGGRTRGPLIKRWIGAARRRRARGGLDEAGRSAEVVKLTWVQTFGRPSVPQGHGAAASLTLLFQPRACL